MIHINPLYRERDLRSHLKSIIMPEYYQVFSINDFLENKGDVKPTLKIWPPPVFCFGEAIVSFHSVAYTYTSTGPVDAEISDGINTLDVKISQDMRMARNKGNLKDGDKLYDVRIRYNPESGILRIKDYKTTGPKAPDTSKEPESLPKLVESLSSA